MNNKFDLIKNIYTNEVLILIFENNFSKENVEMKIENNTIVILYKDGEIKFFEVDDKAINEINSATKIIIAEFNLTDGMTDGNIKHEYFVKLAS